MRRLLAILVLAARLLPGQTGATVEGVVTNSVTGAPISGAEVRLWTPQAVHYEAVTNDSGAYRITGMEPGRYRWQFAKSGFVEPSPGAPGVDPRVAVSAGGNPIQLDGQLTPLATVSGRVLDPNGNPAAEVEVGFTLFGTVKTDSDGRFVIHEVRPGSYYLLARPKPPAEAKVEKGERSELVPTYYPSTPDGRLASAITVRGGDDLSGFEIRLLSAPVYRVRGVVLDDAGKPAPNATVWLFSTSEEKTLAGQMSFDSMRYLVGVVRRSTEEATVVTNAEGKFEFRSVLSGDWRLLAQAEPKRDAPDRNLIVYESSNVPARVLDRDLDDLQIRFPQALTLEVRIDYGDRPLPATARDFPVPVILYSLDEMRPGVPRMPVRTAGVLRFTNVPPGQYRIMPLSGFPPGYYAASVRIGGQEVLGQAVELGPGTPPLVISYKPNAGRVRGTVDRGEGATVLLWPQSSSILDLTRAVRAGAGGVFEFGSLAPGGYYAVAVDSEHPDLQPEAVLRGLVAGATSVQVDEGTSPSVALSLTHLPD